jgi:pimeloyl-ACP methyl ester carboxylesterase
LEPTPVVYAPSFNAGARATVQAVQDMHHAIADKTFQTLLQVPGLSVPTRIVQGVHDAVTQGVYAAVRHGSGAVMSLAGVAERLATDGSRTPQGHERAVRSAINGVFGDALEQAGSSLSVGMNLHRDGAPMPLSEQSLAGLRPRVCVFIHGLACDEQSWRRPNAAWEGTRWEHLLAPGDAIDYGALLENEAGVSAIYLRYNTGLPIADNASQLAEQLQQLLTAAPPSVRELVLIGHSMGGLVARGACDQAAALGLSWLSRVRLLICLGTPHQGAMLEKLGHLTGQALNLSKVTQPLARIANSRSQGIKDLRHGLKGAGKAPAPPPQLALRFIAATLGDESGGLWGSMIGNALGDGLVMPSSASDDGLAGDMQRVELAGLGHMALLNHPRVYAQLLDWIGLDAA